ncbi:hypothetical protein NHP190012_11870 [Helicobacter sp. NHP19-012]|uniref:Uncharacterized protein n=1 Tax=Helicobacter gastrofelis TaxID=2849642 RepID=A0ABM7SF99_9HELI|nr:hypothetical protein NHP190012_11870 [Helicobacter sp. NHP19-012]
MAPIVLEPELEKETLDLITKINRIDPNQASTILYDMDSVIRMYEEGKESLSKA